MDILLLYAWGNVNAGDKALAAGTIHWVRLLDPDAHITVVSIYSQGSPAFEESRGYIQSYFPAVTVIGDDLYVRANGYRFGHRRIVRLLRYLVCLLSRSEAQKYFQQSKVFLGLLEADIVVVNGGHVFFWDEQMGEKRRIVRSYLYPLFLARRLGRPYALLAQSVGPFNFRLGNWCMRRVFRGLFTHARAIALRESLSLEHLAKCAPNVDVSTVLDSAFYLQGRDDDGAQEILADLSLYPKGFVALTIRLSKRRSVDALPPRVYMKYRAKLVDFLVSLLKMHDVDLLFICQVPRDGEDTLAVLDEVPPQVRERCKILARPLLPETLRSVYSQAIAVIGMRYHSLVFALSVSTPVMGLYYPDMGPKMPGMMSDFGLSKFALDLDRASSATLSLAADDLLNHSREYARYVDSCIRTAKARSLEVLSKVLRPSGESA